MTRFSDYGRPVAAAVLAFAASALPAAAQEGWATACDGAVCTVSRAFVDATTGSRVATFLAVVEGGGEGATIGAVVPLGTAAEPGLRIVHDGTEIVVPIQVCFPDGCRGLVAVDAAAFDAMAAADAVEVRFFPFAADRPVAVPVPTDGLAAAVAAARTGP